MYILTGNDLESGAVVWWTGAGWGEEVAAAVPVDAADVDGLIAREEAARRVNAPYAVAVTQQAGRLVPTHIKERMRAIGPSVRPDLDRHVDFPVILQTSTA